ALRDHVRSVDRTTIKVKCEPLSLNEIGSTESNSCFVVERDPSLSFGLLVKPYNSRPIPYRDLVPPPELAGDAPGFDVFQPVEIGLGVAFGQDAGVAGLFIERSGLLCCHARAHRLQRRF